MSDNNICPDCGSFILSTTNKCHACETDKTPTGRLLKAVGMRYWDTESAARRVAEYAAKRILEAEKSKKIKIKYFPGFDIDQMRWKNQQLKIRCRADYFTVEAKTITVTVVPPKKKTRACNRCSKTGKGVTLDEDPYMSDIHGDHTRVWMCADCRSRSADEV